MAITVTLSKDLQDLLKGSETPKGLTSLTKKQFNKQNSPLKFKREMLKDMNRGISPVKGGGKWKKYSQSYKDAIRGETSFIDPATGEYVIFRYINGKPKMIAVDGRKLDRPTQVQLDASPTKKVSPVNLRLSGGLHKSLVVETSPRIGLRLLVSFKNKLADIHNRLGAGKKKIKRRLLPTKSGEQFNRNLSTFAFTELEKAVSEVVKEINRQ